MIRVHDLSEVAYGGVVELAEWWDERRIADAKITKRDILKKASFWSYLGLGVPATLMSAFGFWRRYELIAEHMSHGFFFGFPGFIRDVVTSMKKEAAAPVTAESAAVNKAQEVLRRRQAELAAEGKKGLGQGAGLVGPGEVPVTDFQEILA
jgi:hypothetical protein